MIPGPVTLGHSLRGLCGLKLHDIEEDETYTLSQSARTVWIEIGKPAIDKPVDAVTVCEDCVD